MVLLFMLVFDKIGRDEEGDNDNEDNDENDSKVLFLRENERKS